MSKSGSYRRLDPESEDQQADRRQHGDLAGPIDCRTGAGVARGSEPHLPLPPHDEGGGRETDHGSVEQFLLVLRGEIADADKRGGAYAQKRQGHGQGATGSDTEGRKQATGREHRLCRIAARIR